MSWLVISYDLITIDVEKYIQSQPIKYHQIEDDIEHIRLTGKKYKAIVDVTYVNIYDVNILGVIRIIWDLHEHTYGYDILEYIQFIGMSEIAIHLWNKMTAVLPIFVTEMIRPFETL